MEGELRKELKHLQEEIKMYEAEQDTCMRAISLQHGETLQSVVQTLCNRKEKGDGMLKKDVFKLITEICDAEKDLGRQTKISEIPLTECCVKTLEKNERKTIQQYRLAGHCGFLSFQVEFALTDIQVKLNLTTNNKHIDYSLPNDMLYRSGEALFDRYEYLRFSNSKKTELTVFSNGQLHFDKIMYSFNLIETPGKVCESLLECFDMKPCALHRTLSTLYSYGEGNQRSQI